MNWTLKMRRILFLIAFICGSLVANAQSVGEEIKDTVEDAVDKMENDLEEGVDKAKSKRKEKKEKKRDRKLKKQQSGNNVVNNETTEVPASSPANEPTTPASSQNNSAPATGADRISSYLEEFKKLDVSYIGSTQNCVGYNVYALKYKRTWFLATNVNKSSAMSVFIERPPRSEDPFPSASPFLVEGIKGTLVAQYAKKKNRRKKVKDLQLYGFYKFKKPGKRAVKGLLLIEYPKDVNKEPEFFLFKMFYDMFNKNLEEAKPDPNIQKQFEEKLQKPAEDAMEKAAGAVK